MGASKPWRELADIPDAKPPEDPDKYRKLFVQGSNWRADGQGCNHGYGFFTNSKKAFEAGWRWQDRQILKTGTIG